MEPVELAERVQQALSGGRRCIVVALIVVLKEGIAEELVPAGRLVAHPGKLGAAACLHRVRASGAGAEPPQLGPVNLDAVAFRRREVRHEGDVLV